AAADKAEAPKVATEATEAATGSGSPRKKLGPAARRRARRKEQKEEKRKEKAPSSDLADDRHELERLAQAVAKSRQEKPDDTEFPSRVRRRSGKKREADKLLETEERYLSKVRRMQE
ncbi:RNA binding motif protein 28, partial [Perkinsus olseni]